MSHAANALSGSQSSRAATPPFEALVREVAGLVSPPEVCVHLFELARSETARADDYARVIACDPSLAARLLRLVNSPLYGLRARVDNLPRAVAVVGMRELHALALAVSSVRAFSGIAASLVDMRSFWRHSVLTALLSRALAARAAVLHPERLFLAGLLHDIGELVLFHRMGPLMADLLLVADGDEALLYHLELDALGFTHAEVGGHLLGLWQLPAPLRDAVTHHHRPEQGGLDARLVAAADRLANTSDDALAGDTSTWDFGRPETRIGPSARIELVGRACEQLAETLALLSIEG